MLHPLSPGPRHRLAACVVAVAAILAFSEPAAAAAIVNGDFENGNLTGWTVANEPGGSGSWVAYSGRRAPISNRWIMPPPDGRFAATSDQMGPGAHLLYQDVALPADYQHTLSFVWYYNSAGALRSPASLSFRTYPNQQYRVDVMSPAASVFSVSSTDILVPVVGTEPGQPTFRPPTTVTADLTEFAGRIVRLRFAKVANVFFFDAGVDMVQVYLSPTTKAQCSGGGWRKVTDPSGAAFRNRGDCIAWVATNGRNPPGAGNPVSKPVGPPASRPVGPPLSPPVGPPVSTPHGPPVSTPVGPPVSIPVGPPVAPPVGPPTR